MSDKIILALRAAQVALAIVNIGLDSFVIHWHVGISRKPSPSSFSFLLFAPLFSLLSIAYLELAPRRFPKMSHPFASLGVEFANTVFYFAGFIACAAYLGSLSFCIGHVCRAGRTVAVMAAFEFVAWIATTILLAKSLFKGGLGGFRVTKTSSAPPMEENRAKATSAPSQA
jgi:hypothetical protein